MADSKPEDKSENQSETEDDDDDDDDDDEFKVTSFLGDGAVSGGVVTLGNSTGLETVTVKNNGTIIECADKEPDIAGPSGVGVEVYRQMVVKGGRYKKHRRRWTSWNYPGPKGTQYPPIGPMPSEMTPHESLQGIHGIRLPVITMDTIPNARRDVNLVSTISTAPSVDADIVSDLIGSAPVISKDDTETISTFDTDNTATPKTDNTATPQTKVVGHLNNVAVVTDDSDDEPEQQSHRRGTYHIQKKRSSFAKNRAFKQNMDVLDSAPESTTDISPPTPQVIRPKPGPAVFDPIYTIYGLG